MPISIDSINLTYDLYPIYTVSDTPDLVLNLLPDID